MEKFYCDGLKIRDAYGRERIFRGMNMCYKMPHLSAEKLLGFMDSKRFQKWIEKADNQGVNIIRFGLTWSALEPKEGKYDDELIEAVGKFFKILSEHGIYVMLDMHQDLYSSYFHGDGMPKWAVNKEYSNPKQYAIWAEGYFYMQGVQNAFNDFWNDRDAVQTKFVKMWSHLTKKLADCGNIIGYDYLNEPYIHENGRKTFLNLLENIAKITFNRNLNLEKYFAPGKDKKGFAKIALKIVSVIKTPGRLRKLMVVMDNKENFKKATQGLEKYTQPFNEEYYQPFFDRMSREIGCDDKFNFFEHNYYSNLGIPFEIKVKENDVYSPHAYDVFIDSKLYNKYSSNNRISAILDGIRENQIKMNAPVLFGEWGGGAPGNDWIKHIDFIMGEFEKYHWSSIYWGYDMSNSHLEKVFNRPYPVAVCGDITKIHTDSEKRIFTLEWQCDRDYGKDVMTEVYVPQKGVLKYHNSQGNNRITVEY